MCLRRTLSPIPSGTFDSRLLSSVRMLARVDRTIGQWDSSMENGLGSMNRTSLDLTSTSPSPSPPPVTCKRYRYTERPKAESETKAHHSPNRAALGPNQATMAYMAGQMAAFGPIDGQSWPSRSPAETLTRNSPVVIFER